MEDKPIIIPHCTQNATSDLNDSLYPVRSRLKLETKWDIMSRSDQMQYYSSDKKYQLLALNSAPSLIELWDLSSSPVALASLNFAVNGTKKTAGDDKEPNKYDDSGCQCIAWSHCQRYLFAVFGKQSHIAVSERNHIIETNTSVFHLWDIFLKVEVGSFRYESCFTVLVLVPCTSLPSVQCDDPRFLVFTADKIPTNSCDIFLF